MIDDWAVAFGGVAQPPRAKNMRAKTRGRREGRIILMRRNGGNEGLKGRGLMFTR